MIHGTINIKYHKILNTYYKTIFLKLFGPLIRGLRLDWTSRS